MAKKEQLKKLVAGETIIKTLEGTVKGKYGVFHVYYGNYVYPNYDGMDRIKNPETYKEWVEDFLNSEEGQSYACPSEEEFKEAEEEVRKRLIEYSKQKQNEAKGNDDDKVEKNYQGNNEKQKFQDDDSAQEVVLEEENKKLQKEKKKLEKELEKAKKKELAKKRPRTQRTNDILITLLSTTLIVFSLVVAIFMYLYTILK